MIEFWCVIKPLECVKTFELATSMYKSNYQGKEKRGTRLRCNNKVTHASVTFGIRHDLCMYSMLIACSSACTVIS